MIKSILLNASSNSQELEPNCSTSHFYSFEFHSTCQTTHKWKGSISYFFNDLFPKQQIRSLSDVFYCWFWLKSVCRIKSIQPEPPLLASNHLWSCLLTAQLFLWAFLTYKGSHSLWFYFYFCIILAGPAVQSVNMTASAHLFFNFFTIF